MALAGAAAALTGLLFVGVSINLKRILSHPRLADRALESLILLIHIVLISSLCLVPGQSTRWLGGEILLLGLVVWTIALYLDLRICRISPPEFKRHARRNIIMSQLAILPYICAGPLIFLGTASGAYWLIPAIFLSLLKALSDAWVLLVEINR